MKLLQLLNERKDKSGIVYCATRKNVEEICDLLLSRGSARHPLSRGPRS